MDLLARNLDDLRAVVQKTHQEGCADRVPEGKPRLHRRRLTLGNLMLSVMGAFAEFERALTSERQREGIALAKKRGAYRGRKKAHSTEQAAELAVRAAAGAPKAALAREYGISSETVYQYIRPKPLDCP
jgi:DNA invertase Pin-like site-specific DNA recombinase